MKRLGLSLTTFLTITAITLGCSNSQPNIIPNLNLSPLSYSSFNKDYTYDSAGLALRNRNFVFSNKTLMKIQYKDKIKDINYFENQGMDIWAISPKYVMGEVPEKLFSYIKENNYKFQMIAPQKGMTIQPRFDSGYYTYKTMTETLKKWATENPSLITLQDIGDSWEKTQGKADRDIWAVKITSNKVKNSKPGVVFYGAHHARELVTVELPMLLIKHLTDNYGKDSEITQLVDTREIWIIPMVNPDGHIKVEQGKSWRKNTNTSNNGDGTDLNRNYGYKWGISGASSYPKSETYKGPKAFSEPETCAIRDFLAKHNNIKASMSWHSYSNLVLWPWSYGNDLAPDHEKLSEMGKQMASYSGYTPEQSADMYPAAGDTDDWSYSQHHIFAFTVEVGSWNDGFDPPYSSLPRFWNENKNMCMYLIKKSGEL